MARRILPEQHLSQASIRAAIDRIGGLDFSREVPPGLDSPGASVWKTKSGTEVQLVEDQLIGVRYIWLNGLDEESLFDEITKSCPVLKVDFVSSLAERATSTDEWIRLLHLAAVLATPGRFDRELCSILERGTQHHAPEVRHEAVFAMSYAAWPEFLPLLRRLLETEDDETVAELVAWLLEPLSEEAQ